MVLKQLFKFLIARRTDPINIHWSLLSAGFRIVLDMELYIMDVTEEKH